MFTSFQERNIARNRNKLQGNSHVSTGSFKTINEKIIDSNRAALNEETITLAESSGAQRGMHNDLTDAGYNYTRSKGFTHHYNHPNEGHAIWTRPEGRWEHMNGTTGHNSMGDTPKELKAHLNKLHPGSLTPPKTQDTSLPPEVLSRLHSDESEMPKRY